MAEHNTLTDPELHEPKGAAAANSEEIYVADGSGSGDWVPRFYTLSFVIADVSTAETIYLAVPYDSEVARIDTVLEGAVSGADATLTAKNTAGSSMGTITIAQSGSAAGDVESLEPASNNTVSAPNFITIETDGGSTDSQRVFGTVVLERV